jgi:O-antigen ligase
MNTTIQKYAALILPLIGAFFAWRLIKIPSRMETALFFIVCFIIPTLKWPRFGVYYLLTLPIFIPLGRRLYYLISNRPTVDYLMLIGDGVMIGFIGSLLLYWILNREKISEPLTVFILAYAFFLFLKVFFLNEGTIESGLYGFKFNGLYVLFYFAGSYVIDQARGMIKVLLWGALALALSALWSLKQITFGFSDFEQKWLDSITFTTLRIEGVVRPFGTFVSPAAMSDAMCILIMLGAFFIGYRRGLSIFWGGMLIGLALIPLLIATVRTSWIGCAAGLFFLGFFLRVEKLWLKSLIISFMLLGVVAVLTKGDSKADSQNAALSSKINGSSMTDVMIRNRTAALANPMQEYSIRKRMEIWGEIWYFAQRKPFGRGQGTQGYAHSYYFQILGEIGFPGIISLFGILFFAFRRGFQILRLNPPHEDAELTRYFMSLIFMFVILNLTGTHLHTNPGDVFFWFSVGGLSQLYRNARQRLHDNPIPIIHSSPLTKLPGSLSHG